MCEPRSQPSTSDEVRKSASVLSSALSKPTKAPRLSNASSSRNSPSGSSTGLPVGIPSSTAISSISRSRYCTARSTFRLSVGSQLKLTRTAVVSSPVTSPLMSFLISSRSLSSNTPATRTANSPGISGKLAATWVLMPSLSVTVPRISPSIESRLGRPVCILIAPAGDVRPARVPWGPRSTSMRCISNICWYTTLESTIAWFQYTVTAASAAEVGL